MIGKTNAGIVIKTKNYKLNAFSIGANSTITLDDNNKWHSVCTVGGRTTYQGVANSYNGNVLTYEEAVDLTDVEAIECSFSLNSYTNRTNTQIFVSSSPIVSTREAIQPNKISSLDFNTDNSVYPATMSLNVSNLSGEYYIGFTMFSYDTSSSKHDGYIYDVNLIRTKDRYGDGSLNVVNAGYNGHIALNGSKSNVYSVTTRYGSSNYYMLNKTATSSKLNAYGLFSLMEAVMYKDFGTIPSWANSANNTSGLASEGKFITLNQWDSDLGGSYKAGRISSGVNTKTFREVLTGGKTFGLLIYWAGYTGSASVSDLKFMHIDAYYSLKELVDLKIIKPLVLISNYGTSTSYNCDALKLYDNSGSCSGNFTGVCIMFMTNKNANITGLQITSSKSFSNSDGWRAGMTDIENFDVTYVD